MNTNAGPLDLLLEQHGVLADLFASHQEALLDRRWTEAARLLEDYDRRLRGRIRLEEEHLLNAPDGRLQDASLYDKFSTAPRLPT
jgi:hypothetical protein